MEDKLGKEPAFPCEHAVDFNENGYIYAEQDGISKRLYIATHAMQGLLANPNYTTLTNKSCAGYAFSIADEMLKQEVQ